MEEFTVTERSAVRRLPKRGNYERSVIYGILDEGFVCHVGFCLDAQPFVIPTGYARAGDLLYIHGSPASRMLGSLKQSIPVCVTVTLIDGLVLARSAFHHSINYRSVVVFGRAVLVEDAMQKVEALRAFSEHVVPGRWDDVRQPSQKELKATMVLALDLEEASAKVRTGPPIDDEEDYALPIWAGVIPLRMDAGPPVRDPRLKEGIEPPSYALDYSRAANSPPGPNMSGGLE
jgi:nitroimidazol reductase NimA-like FMN-containing flavoprotein (pyridoxamine 5'-phosphate oxidase superfamily)